MVRDTVVSVRVSTEEQTRLRKFAASRGVSISDYVRSIIAREVSPARGQNTITTTGALSRAATAGQGIFWQAPPGATAPSPATLMLPSH